MALSQELSEFIDQTNEQTGLAVFRANALERQFIDLGLAPESVGVEDLRTLQPIITNRIDEREAAFGTMPKNAGLVQGTTPVENIDQAVLRPLTAEEIKNTKVALLESPRTAPEAPDLSIEQTSKQSDGNTEGLFESAVQAIIPAAQAATDNVQPEQVNTATLMNRLNDVLNRADIEGNEDDKSTFTAAVNAIATDSVKAAKTEQDKFIARQQARKFIQQLINPDTGARTAREFVTKQATDDSNGLQDFFGSVANEFAASFSDTAAALASFAGAEDFSRNARALADAQRNFFEADNSSNASKVGAAVGNILSFLVPGGALKIVGTAAKATKAGRAVGSTVVATTASGIQTAGYTATDFRRDYEATVLADGNEIDEEVAQTAELFGAVIGTATELYAPFLILRRLGGTAVDKMISNAVKTGTAEGGGAVIGDIAKNLVASNVLEYDPDREAFSAGRLTQTAEQGAVESTAGAAISMIVSAFNKRGIKPTQPNEVNQDGNQESNQEGAIQEEGDAQGATESQQGSRSQQEEGGQPSEVQGQAQTNEVLDAAPVGLGVVDNPSPRQLLIKQALIDFNNQRINTLEQGTVDAETQAQIDNFEAQNSALLNNDFSAEVIPEQARRRFFGPQPSVTQEPDQSASDNRDSNRRRAFGTRLSEDDRVSEATRQVLNQNTYTPISNQQTVSEITELVRRNGIERSALDVKESNDLTPAQRVTMAQVILDESSRVLQDAKAINDTASITDIEEFTIDLAETIDAFGTELGRGVQAFTIWNKLSPDAIVLAAKKRIEKGNERGVNDLINDVGSKIPKSLPKDIEKNLRKIAEVRQQLSSKGELTPIKETIIESRLQGELAKLDPHGYLAKLRTAQTIAMLWNTKTQIRNILGNTFYQIGNTAADFIAVPIDVGVSIFTGKRGTRNVTKAQLEKLKGFGEPRRIYQEGVELNRLFGSLDGRNRSDFRAGLNSINTIARSLASGRIDATTNKEIYDTVLDSKLGRFFESTLTSVMGVPDIVAHNAEFRSSLSKRMAAAQTSVPDQLMIEGALIDANKAIFQDLNFLTRFTAGAKRFLNLGLDFGIGDVVLKFTRVPSNLVLRAIEFSPAGAVQTVGRAVYDTKIKDGGTFDQKAFSEGFAKSLIGSTNLFVMGAIMAEMGLVTSSDDRDPDVRAANRDIGMGAYKLNASAFNRAAKSLLSNVLDVGSSEESAKLKTDDPKDLDVMVSFDWMQPLALTFVMGADYQLQQKDGGEAGLLKAFESGLNTVLQQPLLKGVTDLLQRFSFNLTANPEQPGTAIGETFLDTVASLPVTFTPAALNGLRVLTDPVPRETVTDSVLQTQLNRIKNRIPVLSETLPQKRQVIDGDLAAYQRVTAFNVFFNPAIVTELKENNVYDELMRIRDTTGLDQQFPRVVGKKLKVRSSDGKSSQVELTNEQRVRIQELTSGITFGHFEDITANNKLIKFRKKTRIFNSLTDEDKAKYMGSFISDVFTSVKLSELGHRPSRLTKRQKLILAEVLIDSSE